MKARQTKMQKVADAADISVLFFFQLVLIFEKATRKTMQALVPAALVLHSSSANNTSAISNSAVSTSAITTSAVPWDFITMANKVNLMAT